MSPSIDPRKTALVGKFLKEAFPGDHVYDAEVFDDDSQYYRINEGNTGQLKHRVHVSREFFDDHDEAGILQRLRAWNVAATMRQAGARKVLVTNTGCASSPS
jgi:hypothetical protein